MTIEKFLSFWSQHNTAIIEGLVALVILFALFLAYRSFFGKKTEGADGHASTGAVNLDAAQLEKTLQKILENQALGAKLSANSDDLSVDADVDMGSTAPNEEASGSAAGGAEAAAEVAQLRATLSESTKKMEALKSQLAQAQEQVAAAKSEAAAAAGGAEAGASAPPGMTSEERNELDNKLKDLEARLAEYEIISEDIADLSRFREENDNLKKEIEALKAAATAAPGVSPAPAPAPAPAVAAEETTPEVVLEAPMIEPEPEAAKLAVVPDSPEEAPAIVSAEPAAENAESANLIDDDLMKEFAAAVEGQKSLEKVAEKAGDGSAKANPNPDDTDKLMGQFEDFVGNKKS